MKLSGWRTYSEGFIINRYQLNKIHWENEFDMVIGDNGIEYLNELGVITEGCRSIKELNLEYIF
ncbi:hypothetical protein ASG01_09965 [Chryseobacterium sp. Leaf180]|uniref:hypothetical protein n=1 Tax=Chryseobacterium sp. Leaf180 TaxID=1736289 RepID=UPI000712ABB4|nr:hypothetical protein [Chryseobacterium sp. Leaf180]KQR93492.1 hypothetical protein ASG01_09965 [Chryseobacterium sp. Leaf180]